MCKVQQVLCYVLPFQPLAPWEKAAIFPYTVVHPEPHLTKDLTPASCPGLVQPDPTLLSVFRLSPQKLIIFLRFAQVPFSPSFHAFPSHPICNPKPPVTGGCAVPGKGMPCCSPPFFLLSVFFLSKGLQGTENWKLLNTNRKEDQSAKCN